MNHLSSFAAELIRPQKKNTRIILDCVAAAVGAALLIYYLYFTALSVQTRDEAFYFTIPHRFLLGDHMITDEWHLSQFSAVFQILPVKFFMAVTGGTDGIILFLRHLFCIAKIIFYFYFYGKLRKHGLAAVFASVAFTSYDLFFIAAFNYYEMSVMSFALCASVLFLNERPGALRLVFAGAVFACCVLNEPFAAFLYFGYTAVCAVMLLMEKKKSYRPPYLCSRKAWGCITAGIGLCAAAFLLYLQLTAGLGNVIKAIPELTTDAEYDFSLSGGNIIDFAKLAEFLIELGVPALILGGSAFAAVLIKKKLKGVSRERAFLLFSLCYLFAMGCAFLPAFFASFDGGLAIFTKWYSVYLAVFGFECAIITEKRNRGLFLFWLAGFAFTVVVDISSACSSATGVQVCILAGVPLFADCLHEILTDGGDFVRNGKTGRFVKGLLRAVIPVTVAAAVFAQGFALYMRSEWFLVEDGYTEQYADHCDSTPDDPLDTVISGGPHKGIVTTAFIAEKYDEILSDLDTIKELTTGPVCIGGDGSWYYLYLGLPYSVYSTYYVPGDIVSRDIRWWELHPDQTPEIVFVADVSTECYGVFTEHAENDLEHMKQVFPNAKITRVNTGWIMEIPED
ncbi:MAG: hypothetical protein IJK89_07395 [Clostridia bacterium]|nr:hypothetical protein [Clostridia bacterium]